MSSAEELEKKLNEHGTGGWKVINVVPNLSGSVDQNTSTFILEKVK
ncbi:hypothetical protein [Clostridium yunnanense]|nr:hypothetical protein [Clostridium yunnanense]